MMLVYGYLTIILLLFYAYIYVWSRAPRDGKLSKRIRGLEHEVNRLRKRALKKQLVLVALLGLFLLPIANPPMSSLPAAIPDEPFDTPFLTAAEGDPSGEDITEFYETTADDIYRYPDLNTTAEFGKAYNGSSGYTRSTTTTGAGTSGTYLDTYVQDSTYMHADSGVYLGGGTVDYLTAYDWLWWRIPQHMFENMSDIKINYYGKVDADTGGAGSEKQYVEAWNWSSSAWDIVQSGNIHTYSWKTTDTLGSNHYTTEDNYYVFKIRFYGEVDDGIYNAYVETVLDYAALWFNLNETIKGTSYYEDFAGASDWSEDANCDQTAYSTDNDVLSFEAGNNGGTDYDYLLSDTFTTLTNTLYYEARVKINTTDGIPMVRIYNTYPGDYRAFTIPNSALNTWVTMKGKVDESQVTRVGFGIITYPGDDPVKIESDYFHVGPPDEFGWQHDGSTTEAVTDGGGGSSSSDGDELTLTADSDGSSFEFVIDTTATAAYLDADYYPMISLDFNDADSADYIKVESYDGAAWATVIANTTVGTDTHHANCRAADADIEKFRISVNPSANPRLKWFKAFSIANFTVAQTVTTTDQVLYVEDGSLKSIKSDTNYLQLEYDVDLTVAANYNVFNLTISNIGSDVSGNDFGFRDDTWGTWTFATRGLTDAPLDDFKIIIYESLTLSAIKFWEDATAPDILDKFITPNEPDDDESTTLTAVTSDGVSVYDVTINAVVSADGFSDVDYDMTEQQTDLWTYEFATLPDGYYLFEIRANDGANTYSEYLPVTVRESTIVVEEITLIGAGSDFTMMQFSARINKDCSYIIYEESENNAEAATHSGSVSEPSFNLAWTKLDTTDTNVNFTIKFTNDTLTYNYTSQYQVAQTVLSVTSYDWGLSESQVTISFQTSKGGTYTVYLDDVQDSTSSFVTGSNFLNWSRPSAVDPAEIDAAVKLTDGTTTIWLNQTYSEYSLTAFSIQTLFMDLTDPSISAIFTTSWGNATGYLYEADVQKTTGAEGTTLSYTKSTTAGTYNVALKIDGGGEIAWYNTTYTVAVTTLQVTDDSIRTTASYAYLTGHVNLNANYIVYEETVQVGTGSVTAGSFEIRWTKASSSVENVTVLFESGSQSYPVYSGYDVAAQVTFVVESWWMDLNLGVESYVEFYVLSSFENATVYVYDNNTLMTTVTESAGGAYSYFWLSESEGLHTITLNITHGATVHTRTRTYYIPDWAATGLVVRWDLWTFQDNYTMLELGSNWMNCTYYVYLNGSLVATSANDPVTLNFTRAINIGTYNLTIYADGGAQTYTVKNIRYIVTEEGVTYDYSSITGGRSVRYGDNYEGDNYEGDTYENPPGIYMTAETAATIAVSTVFIFFLAVLFMNSRVKKAQLDRDEKETQ